MSVTNSPGLLVVGSVLDSLGTFGPILVGVGAVSLGIGVAVGVVGGVLSPRVGAFGAVVEIALYMALVLSPW